MSEIEDIIARAWDREEAAQMGEPSPWESEKLCGEPLDKDWIAERIGCAGAVIDALDAAGYVIAPKEPNDAMISAGLESLRENSSFVAIDRDPLFVWRFMLHVRPR